jgi:hypothetical protein
VRYFGEANVIRRLSIPLWCLATCLLSQSAYAQGAPGASSGKWTASSLSTLWRIGDWGPACGPKPSGGNEAGGPVTVEDDGKTLTLRGLGRTYRTNQCWEQFPGLVTQSSAGGGTTHRTVCKSAPGDPRQATITTTWTVRPDALYFDEAGQYQFVVENQNCTASVRRTRVLKRVVEQAPAPTAPPPVAPAPATPPPATTPASPAEPPPNRCQQPGPARRLEVSPAQKLMLPGEKFTFRSVVRDATGCRLEAQPQWAIQRGEVLGRLAGPGTLEIPAEAADGTIALRATLEGKSVDVSAQVVSRERYEALLAGGNYGASGESKESAVTMLAGATIDAEAQVVEGRVSRLPWLVAGLAVALLLGVLAWAVLGRQHQKTAAPPSEVRPAPAPPAPPEPNKVCPVCGETYPSNSEFCGKDGAQLMRMN